MGTSKKGPLILYSLYIGINIRGSRSNLRGNLSSNSNGLEPGVEPHQPSLFCRLSSARAKTNTIILGLYIGIMENQMETTI